MNNIAMINQILLCLIIVTQYLTVDCTQKDDWKCHNTIKNRKDHCSRVTYRNTRNQDIKCHICNDYDGMKVNTTICNTVEFKVTISMILDAVPEDIEHLVIYYDNKWNGYLPLTPDPIVLEEMGRLRKLKYFQLTDSNYKYYQLYPIKISEEALRNLTELRSLVIRIPLVDSLDVRLGDMVSILHKLELFDVSYSRGISAKSLRYLLEKLHHKTIKHLCLRKYQLVGGDGYSSNFGDVIDDLNVTFSNLIELDISDNTIARMPPGISNVAPALQKYDISGNMLLDTSNMAVLFEAFMHPTIQIFNAGYQGFRGRNPDPFINTGLISTNMNHIQEAEFEQGVDKSYSNQFLNLQTDKIHEELLLQRPDSIPDLKYRQMEILFQCLNQAGSNISSTFYDSKATCAFVTCILPSLFKGIDCSKQQFIPSLSDVYQLDCMLYMRLPVGQYLKEFYFPQVHLEQAATVGFRFTGKLCLRTPNQLQTLFANGNGIWMQTAQVGKIVSDMDGIEGFENLTTISLSNNSVSTAMYNSSHYFSGLLPNVETVDISGNYLNFTDFCRVVPKLKWLDLKHSNLTKIPPSIVKNCPHLHTLYFGFNLDLDVKSLDSLDLNGTEGLKLLDLRACSIDKFSTEFSNKMDTYPNLTLDLGFNPMHCDCHSQDFARWIIKSKHRLKNYHKYYCSGPGGLEFFENIKTETFWSKCKSYSFEEVLYSVVTTISIALLILLVYILYNRRWRLKHAFFTASHFFQSCCFSKDKGTDKRMWKYDAFISYAAEDRFWVHDTLMKTLENKYGFQLCIHYRDFPVGGGVAETISQKMSQSREIVLVLSDVALKSEWCQFELDEALSQIHRRRQMLIVIKLGKIQPYVLTSKVANVLDNHTFLEWSHNNKHHKLFWAQLVGKLYSDPYGSCLCCCPYGARSLGYKDIVDPQLDGEDSSEEDQEFCEANMTASAKEYWKQAKVAKSKAKKAKGYRKQLQRILEGEELPSWAFGPTPFHIDQLLKDQKPQFDDMVCQHARQRISLLINCLHEHYKTEFDSYKKSVQKVNECQATCGSELQADFVMSMCEDTDSED